MRIWIDGDGCPVVACTVRLAEQYGVPCTILCDTAHRLAYAYAETITVDRGADSVDFRLVNLLAAGDLVVTQDYGLAAMCLARGAVVLHQDGFAYTADNIDGMLLQRHTAKQIRRGGGRLKGQSRRTAAQDAAFAAALERCLSGKA